MISVFNSVQSFVAFLWNWFTTGGQLVDQNTANLRAAICALCHNNLASGEVRKGGCCGGKTLANAAITLARATIIKNKSTPSDGQLLTCKVCGCDNRISVWIPNVALLSIEDANAYPTFCYKKKRLENLDI